MKATKAQLAKIHIAKKVLGLDEETYRETLLEYGVKHSNELLYGQAIELLKIYEKAGFKAKAVKDKIDFGKMKYSSLDGRGAPYASSSKLRKIEALWRQNSRVKTDESLRKFINRITGISHITFLDDSGANKIINAIYNLDREK